MSAGETELRRGIAVLDQYRANIETLAQQQESIRVSLEEHLRAYPKDVEDYDWIGIITGVPRSAGFGQWSAAQDVAAGQDAEQESMPARRAGDSSATRAVGHMPGR